MICSLLLESKMISSSASNASFEIPDSESYLILAFVDRVAEAKSFRLLSGKKFGFPFPLVDPTD